MRLLKPRYLLVAAGLFFFLGSATCAFFVYGFFRGSPLPTVAGPEDAELAGRLTGTMVLCRDRWGTYKKNIEFRSLSSMETLDVLIEGGHIAAIDGPDSDGHFVFLFRSRGSNETQVRTFNVGTPESIRTLCSFRGEPFSSHDSISLAESGGAILVELSATEGSNAWECHRLSLHGGEPSSLYAGHSSRLNPRWVRPGEQFVIERLTEDRQFVEYTLVDLPGVGETVLHREPHHVGGTGLASITPTDTGTLLVVGREGRWVERDGVGHEVVEQGPAIPGLLFGTLLAKLGDHLFYEGLPTEGERPVILGGRTYPSAAWSIKVYDTEHETFATLLYPFRGALIAVSAFDIGQSR